MLKAILSFIWDRTGLDDLSNLSLDLNEQDALEEDTQSEELKGEVVVDDTFTCKKKTGIITSVGNDHFIIDDTFYLKQDATLPPLKVGAPVAFTTYLSDDEVQVTNLEAIDPVWNFGEAEEAKTWCYRTVISQVSSGFNDTFIGSIVNIGGDERKLVLMQFSSIYSFILTCILQTEISIYSFCHVFINVS